jgi:hypothetical protein
MNTRTVSTLAVLAAISGAGGVAHASGETSPWRLALLAGDAIGMHGSLRAPIRATVADLGAVDPALAGESGSIALHRLQYDDMFRPRYSTGVELGYAFDDALQAYGRLGYESLDGRSRDIGAVTGESSSATGEMRARMADVHNESLELGSRYAWMPGSAWRPYAGVALGATRVDAMRGALALQAAPTAAEHVRFTRGDTVFNQRLETGVEFDPGNNVGVRLSVEADHTGLASNAHDPKLLALGYDPENEAQARWAFPVTIAATWRF